MVLIFVLNWICSAFTVSVVPPQINLGSAKPGDEIENKKRLLVEFSEEVDVEKIRIAPIGEEDFYLVLEGKDRIKIPATYSCKKISFNKKARIIHIEVTVKITKIRWEYIPGKYKGKINLIFSGMPENGAIKLKYINNSSQES